MLPPIYTIDPFLPSIIPFLWNHLGGYKLVYSTLNNENTHFCLLFLFQPQFLRPGSGPASIDRCRFHVEIPIQRYDPLGVK